MVIAPLINPIAHMSQYYRHVSSPYPYAFETRLSYIRFIHSHLEFMTPHLYP